MVMGIEGMLPLIHMTILQKFSRYYWLDLQMCKSRQKNYSLLKHS